MIKEYILNGKEVLIQDSEVAHFIKRDNHSQIDEELALRNKLEILDTKRAQKIGELNQLRTNLENVKITKSLAILISLISLGLLTLLEIFAAHTFSTILTNFLINTFVLGSFNVVVRIILKKFAINDKKYAEKEDTLNKEISYLKEEIEKANQNLYSLKGDTNDLTITGVKKSLEKYNKEQELLLDAKLQLIEEYQKRKKEYLDNFNNRTLSNLVSNADDEILIRELILKDIKNNKK